MKNLDIGEVVEISGFPASTLRFYEEKKLIKSIGRRGLRRLFKPDIIEKLSFIALAQHAGFSLDQIGNMFSANGRPKINRSQLLDKANELDETIKKLIKMRDGLRHTSKCTAKNHFECPNFKRILNSAVKKNFKDL